VRRPPSPNGVPAGAHEWVSFDDPDEERTWLVDVTFLESGWECIYGRGCRGVLTEEAPELEEGCCSYGAHFTGEEDARRVEAAAEGLTSEQWQFREVARQRGGPLRRRNGRATTTRLVEGACIFLNRPGYPSGAGCALHLAALQAGSRPLAFKPDVCWQLPLRRDESVGPDGHVTTSIGEWRRRHWGVGGADFAWWCTESPDAFIGREPVYRTMREELLEMMGEKAYRLVTDYLEARRRLAQARPRSAAQPVRVAHPTVRNH